MILSAAAEAPRSWAWLMALVIAYCLFLLLTPLIRKITNRSPTPALPQGQRVKVQAKIGVTEDEPAEPEIGWWGRIVEIGGVRMRQAKQIMATGSHELPPAEEEEEAIDVALDDEVEDGEQGEAMDAYIERARGLRVSYNQIVRVVVDHYGVSESTAKRAVRRVDEQRHGERAA